MSKKTFTILIIIAVIAQFVLSGPVTAALSANISDIIENMFSGPSDHGNGNWSPTTGLSTVWDGTVKDSFSGGTGQAHDPYLITCPHELAFLGVAVNNDNERYNNENVHYQLCNDLDLNGIPWTPIGFDVGFRANFIGGNYEISGLYIDTGKLDGTFFGLFGTNLGWIRYLNLRDVRVESTHSYAEIGALCGSSCGIILDCHAEDVRISFSGVPTSNSTYSAYGGLIGATAHINSSSGTVERCSVSDSRLMVDVGSVGGLIGYCETPIIECYASGVDINAYRDAVAVGGLVGELCETTRKDDIYGTTSGIERCCADVSINSSADYVGGLLGRLIDSKVVDSYARGKASVNGSLGFGGFVGGVFGGKIGNRYCAFDSDSNSNSRTGGFIGTLTNSWETNGWVEITRCIAYTMPKIPFISEYEYVSLFACDTYLDVGTVRDAYYLSDNISTLPDITKDNYILSGESISRSSLESDSFYERIYWDSDVWRYDEVNIAEYSYPVLTWTEQ